MAEPFEELKIKLDMILEILIRIEERQKKTAALVKDVKEHESHAILGSFGTVDTGKEDESAGQK